MTGVIDGFRWMLSHTRAWPDLPALISGLVALFLLAGGAYAFRRMERNFSDIL
jgi:ABC-type polysaccharide/polyol phosphate export permease